MAEATEVFDKSICSVPELCGVFDTDIEDPGSVAELIVVNTHI
jgi:hypothetical protein